ncbi:alpha-N-acetylgalactosaminide alpha-2,6-sialyltransferase 5-like [Diadema setosum]|uniref:alpha-N-acetylgalactosaminide alpha-2,6-sialyltransferase 5-like n=1 Tax=Diadema setosum TaxID=31175 RepID=UPI003B3B25CD
MTRLGRAFSKGCLIGLCMYTVVISVLYLDEWTRDKEFRSIKAAPAAGLFCQLRSPLADSGIQSYSFSDWAGDVSQYGSEDDESFTTPTESPGVPGYFLLDSDEPLKLRCGQCALVSSSGHLYQSGAGVDIDSADCVLRMNAAPVIGWTEDVGSRTDIRIIGHRNLQRGLFTRWKVRNEILIDESTRASYIVVPWLFEAEINMTTDRTFRVARRLKQRHPRAKFVFLTKEKHNESETRFLLDTGMRRAELNTWFSTGFVSMAFALDICQNVHVYGLPSSDYCSRHNDSRVPYHYYEPMGRSECEVQGFHDKKVSGHRFSVERAIFVRWSLQNNIMFHYPSWAATSQNLTEPLDTDYLRKYKMAMQQRNNTEKREGTEEAQNIRNGEASNGTAPGPSGIRLWNSTGAKEYNVVKEKTPLN